MPLTIEMKLLILNSSDSSSFSSYWKYKKETLVVWIWWGKHSPFLLCGETVVPYSGTPLPQLSVEHTNLALLTLSLPSSKSTFSPQPLKEKCISEVVRIGTIFFQSESTMKREVLHTVWCNITGEATGEIWTWSLLGVKGLTRWLE